MQLSLFSFTKSDSTSVHKLIKDCFELQLGKVYDKSVVARFISVNSAIRLEQDIKKQKMLIAKINGKVVAFMSFVLYQKHIRLFRLFVAPAYQHKGVGTRLIKYLKKFQKPILTESAAYQSAIEFYSKNGFIVMSESSKEIGDGLSCPIVLMKYYPTNNFVKIGIRKGRNIDYLCVGDVLYAIRKGRINAFYPKLKKKQFVFLEETSAMRLIEKLKRSGSIEPLAEYPFYDLVILNAKC